jgi:hypothetical protein
LLDGAAMRDVRSWLSLVVLASGCAADDADRGPSGCAGPCELGVNDVSVLFPLPTDETERAAFLWLVPRAGEQGPGFPLDLVDELPTLNADLPSAAGYPAAMITALRFDPCFPRLGGPSCQAQLRLIAQPVFPGPSGTTMLDDAAAHLFYALDPSEADAVLDKLRALRDGSPVATAGPLGIHPGLAADRHGATGAAIRALVVAHCRADNLTRITANTFAFDNWGFHRFDRHGDQFVRQELAAMIEVDTSQTWLRQAQHDDLDDPTGTIVPAPADGFEYLLARASFSAGAPVDAGRARDAATRLLAIENPELTDPESTDCASCHLATQARLFAARHGVAFDAATRYTPPAGVDASLVLDPALAGNLGATIAFGWHTRTRDQRSMPSISQRTVNESAAIAAYLSAR